MRSLFYFLLLTTVIVYSCLPEDRQIPSDFSNDQSLKMEEEFLQDMAAQILFDTCCQCQIKIVNIKDCNNCPDTLLTWRIYSNGFNPNININHLNVVYNTWGDTFCIPHTASIKTLCFYSRYGNRFGENFIDVVIRCKQFDDITWKTRNIRIASNFGLDSCSTDSTKAWGCRNIKNDSICGFLLPEQNDNFLDDPCPVEACCLDGQ
jgi:hypothetical protein